MNNKQILELARQMLSAERTAVQNAEVGHERAVEKYQALADSKMQELEGLLLQTQSGMRMINGHPNGDPFNDPPSLR